MRGDQLKNFLVEQRDRGNDYVALQEKPGAIKATNCVKQFYPTYNRKNIEHAIEQLPGFVEQYPGRYVLNYKKTSHRTEPWNSIVIDTRENGGTDDPEEIINDPQPMIDERSLAERRNDELTIRTLMAENAELKAEIKHLRRELEQAEADLAAAEEEAQENAHATMADGQMNALGQVAAILPGIVDRWFALQEQKAKATTPPPAQPQPQQAQSTQDYYEETGY